MLGIVPVKEASTWEGVGAVGQTKADIVEALLRQVEQYIEIDTVLCDREFESYEVYHKIDQRDVTYLISKKTYTSEYGNIERMPEHPSANAAVEPDVPLCIDDEESQIVQFLYVPSRESNREYTVLITNKDDTSPAGTKAFRNQYRRRWEIENEYKTIKGFLPRTSSMDFRIRLFNFVFVTLMYNLWRLTDYLLNVGMGWRSQSKPLVPAAVFARCVGSFLRFGG